MLLFINIGIVLFLSPSTEGQLPATGSLSTSFKCPEPSLRPAPYGCTWRYTYEYTYPSGCKTSWNLECPCGSNEEYKECGTSCQLTCDNFRNPPPCNLLCQSGCFCLPGYVRDVTNGRCIPETACAPQCYKAHEHIDNCGGLCEPQCADIKNPRRCPALCSNRQVCVCDPGYYRSTNGECITAAECDFQSMCSTTEIYMSCGTACEKTCQNYQNSDTFCTSMCADGCFCRPGFVRQSKDGLCVPVSQCIATPDLGGACALPSDAGKCTLSLRRWYYDPAFDQCRPFTYTGCYGNENKFLSIQACMQSCGRVGKPFCPAGYSTVNCVADPCAVTTCRYPNNACVADICGGCKARFYAGEDGRELETFECA